MMQNSSTDDSGSACMGCQNEAGCKPAVGDTRSGSGALRSVDTKGTSSGGGETIRTHIGIFGAMNAGKSSIMNLLTQSSTSIVDSTPGTTADVKAAYIELHEIGPSKLYDTAGLDEGGVLGQKKREKAQVVLKECDILLCMIDPFDERLSTAFFVIEGSLEWKKKVLILYRTRDDISLDEAKQKALKVQGELTTRFRGVDLPYLVVDLKNQSSMTSVVHYIYQHHRAKTSAVPLLPRELLGAGTSVLLNIPMDAETPAARLLRPQNMVLEYALRRFVGAFCYRMDLSRGRSPDPTIMEPERRLFHERIRMLQKIGLKLVITDSQAMDLVHPWTLGDDGKPICPITTFSVIMANFKSGGLLKRFVQGVESFSRLKKGCRILICEACNHDRILSDGLDDIGIVQIPRALKKRFDGDVEIDFAFGRQYQEKLESLEKYDCVFHCGGCMLDQQKMVARLAELSAHEVPITNYGLILSYFKSADALRRVLEPFGIECSAQ